MASETVLLVHGLWMNGMDMTLLRNRISRAGFHARQFSYSTVVNTPHQNALELHEFVQSMTSPVIHFVCHSLGGLVIRHLFHTFPEQKPGKVITLGTPHQSSHAAQQLMRIKPGRILLGKSIENGLLGNVPAWHSNNALGSIAGILRLGLGLLVPGIPRPSDGTVAVRETELEGMRDHITVSASHFGLLLSGQAAAQSVFFLQQGRFNHPP